MQDERTQKRAVLEAVVRMRSPSGAESTEESADISTGGLFIRSAQPMPKSTLVKIELEVDAETTVKAVGRVVWTRSPARAREGHPAGMGVKFVRVDAAGQKHIAAIVAARPKDVPGTFERSEEIESERPSLVSVPRPEKAHVEPSLAAADITEQARAVSLRDAISSLQEPDESDEPAAATSESATDESAPSDDAESERIDARSEQDDDDDESDADAAAPATHRHEHAGEVSAGEARDHAEHDEENDEEHDEGDDEEDDDDEEHDDAASQPAAAKQAAAAPAPVIAPATPRAPIRSAPDRSAPSARASKPSGKGKKNRGQKKTKKERKLARKEKNREPKAIAAKPAREIAEKRPEPAAKESKQRESKPAKKPERAPAARAEARPDAEARPALGVGFWPLLVVLVAVAAVAVYFIAFR